MKKNKKKEITERRGGFLQTFSYLWPFAHQSDV